MLEALKKIIKTIPKLVERAEEAMKDDILTAQERKETVMRWIIEDICPSLGIKPNFLTRWILSVIVDKVAEKLPSKDIVIPLIYKKF